MNLSELIEQWENSSLDLREAERLINLLLADNKRLELELNVENARAPIDVINLIEKAISSANLEKANFGFPHEEVVTTPHMEKEIRMHPTDYIKERTRLYRQTWIVSPLQEAVSYLKGRNV